MYRGYFSSQEIDSHHATEHRSTDQSRNGCRMCCFCHAQPFEITRAKKIKKYPFSNIHARARKLWKHSAMRLAASRTNAAPQFTNRPLMNSVCPPRCPLHSPGLTCMRACTSPRAGAASTIRSPPTYDPHCRVPYFPRFPALARFGRRPAQSAEHLVVAGEQCTYQRSRTSSNTEDHVAQARSAHVPPLAKPPMQQALS
jgi:hypothetical protein